MNEEAVSDPVLIDIPACSKLTIKLGCDFQIGQHEQFSMQEHGVRVFMIRGVNGLS